MMDLITEHIATWTAAKIPQATGGRGRGRGPNGQSPHGIKKLRELILELAVRGKLVPQDSNDEPASVVLEKIAKEKTRLVKEGKIKKQYPLPKISEDEKPFDFLEGWECERLGNIAIIQTGTLDANASSPDGKYPFFTCAKDPLRIDNFRYDTEAVLLAGNGNFDVNYYFGKFEAYQRTYIIEAVSRKLIHIPFLHKLIIKHADKLKEQAIGGVIKYIKIGFLTEAIFSIPPLAEQHRIVAKVDELMALCDKLEQQQTDSNDTHQTLVETLLATLTTLTDPAEFALSWQRIVAHFDTLFTTEESIDQLKQTILQLAVMGKLVPQDPNDEPCKMLLDVPQNGEGKNKNRPKWSGPIEEQEKPFKLPASWAWFRLGDLSNLKHGYAFSGNFFSTEPAPFVLTTPGNFYEKGGFRDTESKRKYYNGPVDPDFIFEPGDLIIPMTEQAAGLLGSPAFIPDDGRVYLHNQRLGKFDFSDSIAPEFAFWFFNCEFFRSELARTCTGMKVRHTSPDRILRVPFPVCPLEEQHRIVAKVDELMALCDSLKKRLNDSKATQIQLADAIVEQALVA